MSKITYLDLFSGIGAFSKAMTNLGINYELVGFSEVDSAAIAGYCAIHDIDATLNLGDIRTIDTSALPSNIDLITHGSPCQSFSIAGREEGGTIGSNTQSGLMWETVRIVSQVKPKYVIWENVPHVLSKNHIDAFNQYLDALSRIGYNNQHMVLNAKHFGVPQNRRRLFVVSTLEEVRNINITQQDDIPMLVDFLDDEVDNKLYIEHRHGDRIKLLDYDSTPMGELIFVGGLTGRDWVGDGKSLSRNFPQGNRIYHCNGVACTQTANGGGVGGSTGIYMTPSGIRKLTPRESMRIMGFSDKDYDALSSVVPSHTQQLKVIGNSVVVPVLEAIFKELL